MNIGEAVNKMKDGWAVARNAWFQPLVRAYRRIDGQGVMLVPHLAIDKGQLVQRDRLGQTAWQPRAADLLAEDWFIVIPEDDGKGALPPHLRAVETEDNHA